MQLRRRLFGWDFWSPCFLNLRRFLTLWRYRCHLAQVAALVNLQNSLLPDKPAKLQLIDPPSDKVLGAVMGLCPSASLGRQITSLFCMHEVSHPLELFTHQPSSGSVLLIPWSLAFWWTSRAERPWEIQDSIATEPCRHVVEGM